MMVPLLLRLKEKRLVHGVSMERFYDYAGISRQGFSKASDRYHKEHKACVEILALVKEYRQKRDRRAGSRSIYHNLGIKNRYGMGINRFERLMSSLGLILPPLHTRVVTTKSSLQSWNYPNLLNGLVLDSINQAVAGDLTYIYLYGKRYFLFCLTDIYSARIVGFGFGEKMRAQDAKVALDQWVLLRGKKNLAGCIHHTDGGGQYFSALYLGALVELAAEVSCAKNCLMNGYAEQRNGLIKHHFMPTIEADAKESLGKEMERIIRFYNQERKQEGLGWLTPAEFEKKFAKYTDRPKVKLYDFVQK